MTLYIETQKYARDANPKMHKMGIYLHKMTQEDMQIYIVSKMVGKKRSIACRMDG